MTNQANQRTEEERLEEERLSEQMARLLPLEQGEIRNITELRIRLPKGIPFILEFYDLKDPKNPPVANNHVPMYVQFGSATVDMRGPERRMRDAIC